MIVITPDCSTPRCADSMSSRRTFRTFTYPNRELKCVNTYRIFDYKTQKNSGIYNFSIAVRHVNFPQWSVRKNFLRNRFVIPGRGRQKRRAVSENSDSSSCVIQATTHHREHGKLCVYFFSPKRQKSPCRWMSWVRRNNSNFLNVSGEEIQIQFCVFFAWLIDVTQLARETPASLRSTRTCCNVSRFPQWFHINSTQAHFSSISLPCGCDKTTVWLKSTANWGGRKKVKKYWIYRERVPKMKANQRMIYHLCVWNRELSSRSRRIYGIVSRSSRKIMLKDMLSLPRQFHAVSSSSLFRLFKFKFQRDCFHNSALPPPSPLYSLWISSRSRYIFDDDDSYVCLAQPTTEQQQRRKRSKSLRCHRLLSVEFPSDCVR